MNKIPTLFVIAVSCFIQIFNNNITAAEDIFAGAGGNQDPQTAKEKVTSLGITITKKDDTEGAAGTDSTREGPANDVDAYPDIEE